MLSQKRDDLTADLQVGDVPIEVDPVEALQIQCDMAVEYIVDIDHLGHPATSRYRLHMMLDRKQAYRTHARNLGGLRCARRRASLMRCPGNLPLTLRRIQRGCPFEPLRKRTANQRQAVLAPPP